MTVTPPFLLKNLPQAGLATRPTVWLVLVFLAGTTQFLRAQDTSLGGVARQTRSEKQSAPGSNKAQALVDRMQQEQEETENAPPGFTTFRAEDYHLWVPFPFEIEGRDNGGTVLVGSRIGVTNTEVMAGTSQPLPGNLSDDDLFKFIRQTAMRYAQSAGCSEMKVGERRAYRCSLGRAYVLNHEVWGSVAFVIGSNSIVPVMCVSPDPINEHLVYGNPRATYQQKQAAYAQQAQRFQDERTTWQLCDQVIYPSIRLKEDDVARSLATSRTVGKESGKPPANAALAAIPSPSVPSAEPQAPAAGSAVPGEQKPATLADLARQKKQASLQPAKARLAIDGTGDAGIAPPGYKTQPFSYCKSMGNCWMGSVFVPTNALLLNSDYSQFVFQVPFGDDKVLLYVGPAGVGGPGRLSTDPNLVRWEEMNAPEDWVARGRVQAVTHDEATIDGKPATLTHFEIKKHGVMWVARRANVSNHEVEVLVGCMAPQNRFADADQTCSMLIDSLRLP